MQLKGMAKVLLAIGATGLVFYSLGLLYPALWARGRTPLLFIALVGLLAGSILYLMSTSRRRL